jgi:hypothetical protein
MAPIAVEFRCNVSAWVRMPATELATVLSRPSGTDATRSAATSRG